MARTSLVVLSTLALGCAPVQAPIADDVTLPFASGARLRAVVLDGGEGAIATARSSTNASAVFYDVQLDVECQFAPTASGWRCLSAISTVGVGFADPACTVPVMDGDVAAGRFVHVAGGFVDGIGGYAWEVTGVYERGATSTGRWYRRTGDACEPVGLGRLAALTPVPLDTFVGAELTHEGRAPLERRVLVASDGARVTLGGWDARRAWPCAAITWSGDGTTCLPWGVAWRSGRYFGDAECTVPAAYTDDWMPEPVAILADDVWPIAAFELSARRPSGAARYGSGECGAAPSDHVLFDVGPPITDLPRFSQVRLGRGRLLARYLGDADDAPVGFEDDMPFWDDVRGEACAPHEIDGVLRCVPAFVVVSEDGPFAEPACAVPLVPVDVPTLSPPSDAPHAAARLDARGAIAELFELDAAPWTQAAYARHDGACVATPLTGTLRRVRQPMPAEALATIARRHD